MFPDKDTALQELKTAEKMNPGPWVRHSCNVAAAAKYITDACGNLDSDKAYVCGLLHDIGRRTGVAAVRHIIDGYDYAVSKGWDEVARVCLTHSFPVKDIEADIGKKDITEEQYAFIDGFLRDLEYDEYDKLIILCDALADADGFCILEKRFIDTTRRYGIFPFSVNRWNKTYEIKEDLESIIGRSIYSLLPGIEKCIYPADEGKGGHESPLNIKRIEGDFSICKVADYSQTHLSREYCFTGKTDEENSLVCATSCVPENVTACDNGWKAFRIEGTLDFSLTGILSKIAALLAGNQIGIFAVSTYNTDYILVKKENYNKATEVLSDAGYQVV